MTCVASVRIYPREINIKVGEWYHNAHVQVSPANANSNVVWSSSNPNVARVNSSSGYIYGESAGYAIISAAAADNCDVIGYCTVVVSEDVLVGSITLNKTSLSLKESEGFALFATVYPTNASNKYLGWYSDTPHVATVDGSGWVCAKKKGSATISAFATDGSNITVHCHVTVTEDTPVTSVTVRPSSMNLKIGQSATLSASVYPIDATNKAVKWSSSDPNIVTVNRDNGLIVAKRQGKATITAAAQDDCEKQDYCTVTVESDIPVCLVGVCPISKTTDVLETVRLNVTICLSNATNKS